MNDLSRTVRIAIPNFSVPPGESLCRVRHLIGAENTKFQGLKSPEINAPFQKFLQLVFTA